jgi:outer membrane protein assembly factor BamB
MISTIRALRTRLFLGAAGAVALVVLGIGLLGCAADDKEKGSQEEGGRGSCPMYGGTIQRNMVNTTDKNIPDTWNVGEEKKDWKNVKWVIDLGSKAYGGPVIAGGKIFIGTNNDNPRDPKIRGDKGVMMCFRESDGKFLWQAVHDKLGNEDRDNPKQGVASTPAVDGNRLYYVSNRCELVCADVEGDPKTGKAKFIWTLDMRKALKVNPCYLANCSPLVIGDLVFILTSHGVDIKTHELDNPDAPSFLAVNKTTGEVAWKDSSPGKNIMEGQWSNPVAAEVKGVMQVVFPGGDGWLYSFEAKTGKLLWKFNCNPKASEFKPGGAGDRNYIVATPVIYEDKLYIGVGQDPTAGPAVGHLWCVDITKAPKNKDKDLSPVNDNFDPKAEVNKDSGLVWHRGGPIKPKPAKGREIAFSRTISTVAIHDGLVYASDVEGYLQCLDANTGELYWEHDLKGVVWASPYYVDGKVFLGNEGADMFIFKAGKAKKVLPKISMSGEILVPAVAVDGVLYVNTGSQLVAIVPDKK